MDGACPRPTSVSRRRGTARVTEHARHDLADGAVVLVRIHARGGDDDIGLEALSRRIQDVLHLTPRRRHVPVGQVVQVNGKVDSRQESARRLASLQLTISGASQDQVAGLQDRPALGECE